MELLLIKFNSLAFIFPEVITLCFLFLTLPVTTATDERNISKLKTDKEISKYFDGTETAIWLVTIIYRNRNDDGWLMTEMMNEDGLINQFSKKGNKNVYLIWIVWLVFLRIRNFIFDKFLPFIRPQLIFIQDPLKARYTTDRSIDNTKILV